MHSPELSELLHVLEGRIVEIRRLNELDTPEPLDRSIGRQLFHASDFLHKAAIAVVINGVRNGRLSKRAAADIVKMHPNTLDRWINRFEDIYTKAEDGSTESPINANTIDKLG